jgi:hypothetical protein
MKETKTKIQHKPCGDSKEEEVDVALNGKVLYSEHSDIQSESTVPLCITFKYESALAYHSIFSKSITC